MRGKIYLISGLVIGIAIGYALRDMWSGPDSPVPTSETYAENGEDTQIALGAQNTADSQAEIAALKLQIASLQSRLDKEMSQQTPIAREPAIAISRPATAGDKPSTTPAKAEPQPVDVLSMDEVQSKFMQQLQANLKHVVIKMDDRQLQMYEQRMQVTEGVGEWGQGYESKIGGYLRQADPNGLHFVNQLRCAARTCKLSVTTGDPNGWQQVLAGMLNTDWHDAISFVSQSDSSPELVYYFERVDDAH